MLHRTRTRTRNQQSSFPELVGQSAHEAKSILYTYVQGLTPVLMKPNQPMTMDYRPDRVRIITDPSGRVVLRTPMIG
ncbi:unnamed protein product [Rotaria sp. Silwood2]|nr:unnamed protein product [Rotaria sp. Silwood2]CAF2711504.1 unnamed protein product [Rotaria sp. Silwood2]CAF3107952.1 unnamed protein product [Rotaria sp. Silwood2]CAF3448755.1 unnamed protein product [Rotaria sp. Silwood2]CAF3928974.1 unnamed protein product [Rotaria sp. Silwood2]